MTLALRRVPLQLDTSRYVEVKDPCPVHDGTRWHLFGTGVTGPHRFEVLHATADELAGPWTFTDPVQVGSVAGSCVAAPGAVVADGRLQLFLQTDYNRFSGRIEHFVATDGDGRRFSHRSTALTSLPGTAEAGVYDAHPASIDGACYLSYAAFSTVGEPDIHLAVSSSGHWTGPWRRLGPILGHADVHCHNQRGGADYEWGLEGAQLVALPDGGVLLNAVCFTPGAAAGSRQRVMFAVADHPTGRYDVLGPVLTPVGGDASGENGHATAVVVADELALFFQERDRGENRWRYGLATVPVDTLAAARRGQLVSGREAVSRTG